jgi:CRP-like cAMP-binding protein
VNRVREKTSNEAGERVSLHTSRTRETLARQLRAAPLFDRLPEPVLDETVRQMRVRTVPRGAIIFNAGDPARNLCLVVEGRVRIVQTTEEGQTVLLRFIQPGEIFGGAGSWGEKFYPATAITQVSSRIAQLSTESFSELTRMFPEFALAVIEELRRRLTDAHNRILELQTQRVEQRVARAVKLSAAT